MDKGTQSDRMNPAHLYIFGAGGFGREVAWLAEQALSESTQLTFLVDDPAYLQESVNGIPVRLLDDVDATGAHFVVAIGDPTARRDIVRRCLAKGLVAFTICHPRAERSRFTAFGDGTIFCVGSVATTNIQVGDHVHINLNCTIGHDVRIGNFATLSPGVDVAGNVHIGEGAFIGIGATIINGSSSKPLVIGAGAVVAAGACVIRDVEPNSLVAGVPAIRKK